MSQNFACISFTEDGRFHVNCHICAPQHYYAFVLFHTYQCSVYMTMYLEEAEQISFSPITNNCSQLLQQLHEIEGRYIAMMQMHNRQQLVNVTTQQINS